jgi:hypothetical protein
LSILILVSPRPLPLLLPTLFPRFLSPAPPVPALLPAPDLSLVPAEGAPVLFPVEGVVDGREEDEELEGRLYVEELDGRLSDDLTLPPFIDDLFCEEEEDLLALELPPDGREPPIEPLDAPCPMRCASAYGSATMNIKTSIEKRCMNLKFDFITIFFIQ